MISTTITAILFSFGLLFPFFFVAWIVTIYRKDKLKKTNAQLLDGLDYRTDCINRMRKTQEDICSYEIELHVRISKLKKELAWHKRREEFKKMVEKAECDKMLKKIHEELGQGWVNCCRCNETFEMEDIQGGLCIDCQVKEIK